MSSDEEDMDSPVGVIGAVRPPQSIDECYDGVDYSAVSLYIGRMITTNKQNQQSLNTGDKSINQVLNMLLEQRSTLAAQQGENANPASLQSINQLIEKVVESYISHRQSQSKLKSELFALTELEQMARDGNIGMDFDWEGRLTEGQNKFLINPVNQSAEQRDIQEFKNKTAFVKSQRGRGCRSQAGEPDAEEGEPGEEGEPSGDENEGEQGEESEGEADRIILPISQSQSMSQSPAVKRERRGR